MNLKRIIFRQYNFGTWLGALYTGVSSSMFYYGMLNYVIILTIAWEASLRDYIHQIFPWVSFPMLLGVLLIIVLAAMLLDFKFAQAARIAYSNAQGFTHKNLSLEAMLKRVDKLEENTETRFNSIEGKIDILLGKGRG